MGFALLAYNAPAAGVNAVNTDMVAVTDPDFSARNNHYVFSEDYRLAGVMLIGASVVGGRFQSPTWNAVGEFNLFNANRALTPPTNPQWDWFGSYQPPIPKFEEFQVQSSNNLGAATEQENALLAILTTDWTPQVPRGLIPFVAKATFTLTPTINVWSGGQAITLTSQLRGGVYAVIGAVVQGANAVAFRIIFPRYKLYQGRKLRPGGPVQTAKGDVINNQTKPWVTEFGEWGRFWTQELPQVEILGATAGAITYNVFLWLVYLGEDPSLLNGGLGGGGVQLSAQTPLAGM